MTRYGRAMTNSTSIQSMDNIPLTAEQIRRYAPSVYALEPWQETSDKYIYIPTYKVLEALLKEGFYPFFAAQCRTRIEGKKNYTKHMLRLRHVNDISKNRAHEAILINSHDTGSSYQMISGMIEFVCLNGHCTGDILEDIRIRHSGNEDKIRDDVIYAAYEVINNAEKVDNVVTNLLTTPIDSEERLLLAETALQIKYGEDLAPIQPADLLKKNRSEDYNRQENLWGSFNIIQENVIRGGIQYRGSRGQNMSTRGVQSIDNNVKLNKALWTMAEKFAALKNKK